MKKADRPAGSGGRQYHLGTRPGDIAARCLLVGAPERAELIAKDFLEEARKVGDHRGLVSYTGRYHGVPVSVVTTGMGGASIGIVLPEAVRSGAEIFIRVGSCGALVRDAKVGSAIIATGAVRLDGASENWAPIEFPALADWRIVFSLAYAANRLRIPHRLGIGITTSCFYEGQARPADEGWVAPRIQARHEELVRAGALFYAMEEASLFVWCATHGGIPCGAVNTVYANRATGRFRAGGDEASAKIALEAIIGVIDPRP